MPNSDASKNLDAKVGCLLELLWLLSQGSDEDGPHIKVLELFTPETMTAFVCPMEMILRLLLAGRLPKGVVFCFGSRRRAC